METPHLTGREGGPFDLALASNWTKNHRKRSPNGIISQFYGKDILQKLLSQPGCVGIRMYYALDERGTDHLILVGSRSDGSDIIPSGGHLGKGMAPSDLKLAAPAVNSPDSSGLVVQIATPCPGSGGCPSNALTK